MPYGSGHATDYRPFSLVPNPIWNTIRGGGAAHPRSRAMPANAAVTVGRHKHMMIRLEARQHTLMLRGNLRFPETVPTEANTSPELALPGGQAAGWDNCVEGPQHLERTSHEPEDD
jgi:hypothetical protein